MVGKAGAEQVVKAAKVAKPRRAVPAPEAMSQQDEMVATSISRNALSRERYEFMLRAMFVMLGILAVSVTGNIYYGLQETQYRYFAVDPEGGIREVVPLERPIQATHEVINWATDSIMQAFTLSFANYETQLADYRHLFTDTGWRGFREALERNRIIDTVVANQLVTSAAASGAPVVVSQGVGENGRYAWRIQLPIVMSYESASGRSNQAFMVEALIVRRPEIENPRGLGIGQIVAR